MPWMLHNAEVQPCRDLRYNGPSKFDAEAAEIDDLRGYFGVKKKLLYEISVAPR